MYKCRIVRCSFQMSALSSEEVSALAHIDVQVSHISQIYRQNQSDNTWINNSMNAHLFVRRMRTSTGTRFLRSGRFFRFRLLGFLWLGCLRCVDRNFRDRRGRLVLRFGELSCRVIQRRSVVIRRLGVAREPTTWEETRWSCRLKARPCRLWSNIKLAFGNIFTIVEGSKTREAGPKNEQLKSSTSFRKTEKIILRSDVGPVLCDFRGRESFTAFSDVSLGSYRIRSSPFTLHLDFLRLDLE